MYRPSKKKKEKPICFKCKKPLAEVHIERPPIEGRLRSYINYDVCYRCMDEDDIEVFGELNPKQVYILENAYKNMQDHNDPYYYNPRKQRPKEVNFLLMWMII